MFVAVVWLDLWTGVEEARVGGGGGSARTYPRYMNWLFEALASGGIHCSALISVCVGGGVFKLVCQTLLTPSGRPYPL